MMPLKKNEYKIKINKFESILLFLSFFFFVLFQISLFDSHELQYIKIYFLKPFKLQIKITTIIIIIIKETIFIRFD